MGINGVSSYANTYTYGNVKNENVKPSKNSEKNYYAGYTMNSANKFKNVSDYSKYLTNKYKCLTPCKNASVLIDGTYGKCKIWYKDYKRSESADADRR